MNNGGTYVGSSSNNALTTLRNAGITNVNTQSISGISTTGAVYPAAIDTTDPAGWAEDNGGFIYRSSGGDAIINPHTLDCVGNGSHDVNNVACTGTVNNVPDAKAVWGYPDPLHSLGYDANVSNHGTNEVQTVTFSGTPTGDRKSVV